MTCQANKKYNTFCTYYCSMSNVFDEGQSLSTALLTLVPPEVRRQLLKIENTGCNFIRDKNSQRYKRITAVVKRAFQQRPSSKLLRILYS